MSYLTIEAQREHLLNDSGPHRDIVVDAAATITAGSGEVADGTWARPYTTIQDALDNLPSPADGLGPVVHVVSGDYSGEGTLTWTGQGSLWLVSHGVVVVDSITATVNNAAGGHLIMLGDFRNGWVIQNDLTLSDGSAGHGCNLSLYGLNLGGNVVTTTLTGDSEMELRRIEVDGNFTAPRSRWRLSENNSFNGDVFIDCLGERVTDCRFGGDITLVGVADASGWYSTSGHFASCQFWSNNTFTGPAGSLRVDPSSEYWFDLNNWLLGGAATKTHIHSLVKQVEFTTGSLAAAGRHDENVVLPSGVDDVNIIGIEVEATAGASTEVEATAYTTDAFATIQAPLVGESGTGFNPSTGPIYGPVLPGPVKLSVPLHDFDGTNELHIRVTNITDAGNSTFRVRIKYQIAGAYA